MSIHPSLAAATKGKQQKTVLKRSERIKHMMEKNAWSESSRIYGLPKIKIVKLKIKKEKVEKAEGAEGAAAAPAGTAAPAAAPAAAKTGAKKA